MSYKLLCPHCSGEIILKKDGEHLVADPGEVTQKPVPDPEGDENNFIDNLVSGSDGDKKD